MALAVMISKNGSAGTLASAEETNLFGWNAESTTEANTQARCTEGATFSLLGARIISGGSGTNNFRFRDAGADGSQLATRAGTGDCEDAVNTDTLSAGDLFNIAYTDTGSSSGIAWIRCNIELASGYGAFHGSASFSGTVHDAASSTRFLSLAGPLVGDGHASESTANLTPYGYDTYESLQIFIVANARTNDSTVTNRVAISTDGSATITIGAGLTGLFYDDGLADSITEGAGICASLTLGTGVEDLSIGFCVALLKSSNTAQDIWCQTNDSGLARTASATAHYFQLGGYIESLTAYTEAQARCKPGFAGTASNLRIELSANTYTGNGTLKLYQNGSAVITTTILNNGGFFYVNSSDSITFDSDDELSFEVDEGTSGSITIHSIGVTLAPTVAGGGGSTGHRSIGAGYGGRFIGA